MPTVTGIQPQKKRQGYYNIHLDGKYALALSESDVATYRLTVGRVIDITLLTNLRRAYVGSRCYNCALRFLAIRPRSIAETRQYLERRKGFSAEAVEYAIKKLINQNYLNDVEFCRVWVRNRLQFAQKPLSIIRLELRNKGVDTRTIDACIEETGKQEEEASLKQLIIKKLRILRYQDKQKLIGFLVRRGYRYSSIQKAFVDLALFEN